MLKMKYVCPCGYDVVYAPSSERVGPMVCPACSGRLSVDEEEDFALAEGAELDE